jgi:ribosome maturation factor RimP
LKHEEIEQRAEAMILPILDRLSLTLVDVEYVREAGTWYLRAYIDKEGGVTVGDCEEVSREMNPLLDREDFIEDAYVFEVSSPGLGRPLKKEKDFRRNVGKDVEMRFFTPVDGEKEMTATLLSFDRDAIRVLVNGKEKEIAKKTIALIREYVDWDA